MWRCCAAAPPGGMRSSHVVAPSSYVRHSRRDPPLDGSLQGFLATPVHHALAPLHRHRRWVAAPWGSPPSRHRPCARRRRRTEAPPRLHLQAPSLSAHRIGSLQAPLSALFFQAHGSPCSGRDKGGEGNSMCTRDCTRGPLLLFFFSRSEIGFASPCRSSPFIVDTPEG